MPEHKLKVESTPSSFEVASASTMRAEAPGYENETVRLLEEVGGVYCTLSIETQAMPTTDATAIISSTAKEDMPLRPCINSADIF